MSTRVYFSRKSFVWRVTVAVALISATVMFGEGGVLAQTVTQGPVSVGTEPSDDASNCIAVSNGGHASSTGHSDAGDSCNAYNPLVPGIAFSTTGDADAPQGNVALSVTGNASAWGTAGSGGGDAENTTAGLAAVSGTGCATGASGLSPTMLTLSILGCANGGRYAIAGAGSAHGSDVGISGGSDASGDTAAVSLASGGSANGGIVGVAPFGTADGAWRIDSWTRSSTPDFPTGKAGVIDEFSKWYATTGLPPVLGPYVNLAMGHTEDTPLWTALGAIDDLQDSERQVEDNASAREALSIALSPMLTYMAAGVDICEEVVPLKPFDPGPTKNDPGASACTDRSEETKVCALNPYDCYRARNSDEDAFKYAERFYPEEGGHNDVKDAFRHCAWSAFMTKRANQDFAQRMATAHEDDQPNEPSNERQMDQHNNAIGRQVGKDGETHNDDWIARRCESKADSGELQNSP